MKDWKFLFEKYALHQHRPEWEIERFLGKIHGRIAFDVGAYHGQYSRLFAKHFETVLAFEPDPTAAGFLHRLNLSNLRVYELALCDEDGESPFYRYDGLYCPGILDVFRLERQVETQANRSYNGAKTGMVKTGLYDHFASDFPVDLVKIDVEGAEFKVLKGMAKAFAKRNVKRILVELHDISRQKELEALFFEHGLRYKWVDSDHVYGELPY